MLTDEELKNIKFIGVSHISMSTYYIANYKSCNTEPIIWMQEITPREVYGPEELSEKELESRPKRRSRKFTCWNKEYAKLQTLNKHVEIKLIEV